MENIGGGPILRTISLPLGNCNRSSFARELKILLNDNNLGYVYDISYNSSREIDNGYYTFSFINPLDVGVSFIIGTSIWEIIGFKKNSTNTFVNNRLTSVNVTNFRFNGTFFLHSDICSNRNNNILQNIQTTGGPNFHYIHWFNTSPREYSKDFSKTKSNVYKFYYTDEDGEPVNFHGINTTFTILVYRLNTIDKLLRGFIKLQTMKN